MSLLYVVSIRLVQQQRLEKEKEASNILLILCIIMAIIAFALIKIVIVLFVMRPRAKKMKASYVSKDTSVTTTI